MVRFDEKKVMRGNKERTVYMTYFDSIQDLVKHCDNAPINTKVFPACKSKTNDRSFTGTSSFEEAKSLLLNGWSQGAEKLTHQLKVAKLSTKEVQKVVYDIVGFQASVPRYLQGIPTNMINTKKVVKKQKVITLIKAVNYNGMISSNQIMQDSVKFLQIVQAIEAKGIRVNVEIVSWVESFSSNEEIFMRIPIKKSSERLNLSKISFPLMHTSMLRRIIFRTRETELRVKDSSYGFGYGVSGGAKENVPALLKANEYYIPAMISEEEAVKIINEAK
jgi:hypothetical protein